MITYFLKTNVRTVALFRRLMSNRSSYEVLTYPTPRRDIFSSRRYIFYHVEFFYFAKHFDAVREVCQKSALLKTLEISTFSLNLSKR